MSRIAVIDFETTGISPTMGDRATEVAIVITEQGRVVDRYQSLMNAGVRIPSFITQLTGITNAMVETAPPADTVMREAARFVGQVPMVAHNAAFDRRFWTAELERAGANAPQPFACTVLLSRRLYPEAPSHKLGSLVDFFRLPRTGQAHRALADAEMAAELLGRIQHDLRARHGVNEPDHGFLMALQRCTRAALPRFIQTHTQRPDAQALKPRAA
ncbi:MAG: 3'-5' exonuclease [Hydrogenophaga sp.]|uniref:3'-5' exonuclease n=1 Tax=Hydrogenophaga sp. TaxID=1904254 RepID=UPI0025C5206F|nr:3'-5' exonuclease [Hydrogenophaga sp.]MBU7572056.1 3'-5' exonuclease [Hydrogenophaga sp.]